MATISFSTTNQDILDELDELTSCYEWTLAKRIKTHIVASLKWQINWMREQKAKQEALYTPVWEEDIT